MAEQKSAEQAKPHVTFTHVQKTYDGETLIVKDLNLEIRRGEFLTLLGPSGSGKTTCLMMLAGFETPTSGEIRVNEQVINRVPPHRRNIGMVFQNYALFPHMTVAENLRFPLVVRKMPAAEIDAKVKRALAMVRLEALGNRYPQQLSGGQQQRIALARALVFNPELVLMDEPLGALDKQLREHMQIEIKHIHDNLGVTFVFVTHDQSEALTMSDRIAVFDRGEIQQIDSAERLYEEPSNAFVAGFIGESNTFTGTLMERKGDKCVVRLGNGAVLQTRAADVGPVGGPAVVSVRPERIVLNGASERCENRLTAKVRELIYLGDHVRVQLDLGNQSTLTVKTPISDLSHEIRPEQAIEVGFPAQFARALAPTPAP
ncbi:ABC transporter ATP-binding protein [Zoogloea sp.]|uniref:ABC transporter ATP-binding protein n=1 Tax=Zoogloea sp. TaxID=49181 RepID=UPI0035B4F1A4|nr:ABC transporter ATP-binding protein [Azovibrio sp.]